jgi:hypothetical protein
LAARAGREPTARAAAETAPACKNIRREIMASSSCCDAGCAGGFLV